MCMYYVQCTLRVPRMCLLFDCVYYVVYVSCVMSVVLRAVWVVYDVCVVIMYVACCIGCVLCICMCCVYCALGIVYL